MSETSDALDETVWRYDELPESEEKRYKGKITKLGKSGWGFINCYEIPFTRIFFHWTNLNHNKAHFTKLKVGTEVTFVAREVPKTETKQGGWTAFEIELCTQNSIEH